MGKLVRDAVIDIMQRAGENPHFRVLGKEEYRKKLLQKLGEEALETIVVQAQYIFTDGLDGLIQELADLDEVMDALCAELVSRGVKLLNGPIDRPWGIRTASFMDPAGHIWEIAK